MSIQTNHKKTLISAALLLFFQTVFPSNWIFAQANIQVTIESGNSTTTCSDFLSAPEPRWRVNVQNTGWVIYPIDGSCFSNPPNVQFDEQYECFSEAPSMITVCFESFEDDGSSCNPDEKCLESICNNYPVPLPGMDDNHTLALPAGLSSGGEVDFTITTTGDYRGGLNDKMCGAIDLGVLNSGGNLGDASLSNYNNYCSNGSNEPNPASSGSGWANNHSVWFTFTTSNDPSSIISFIATSDPQNLGEPMGIQLALYETDDQTCTGNFTMLASKWDNGDLDEWMLASCLTPNTTYFLLVDGLFPPPIIEGIFGLELRDEQIEYSADLICDANDLGMVPDGGQVTSGANQSNVCATSQNDPSPINFSTENTVWFSFVAPNSRHVRLDAISSLSWPMGLDPLDLQLAVFESDNAACDGNLMELGSTYQSNGFDESLELNCLEPGNTYFVMIDGGANDQLGVFELQINDAGYNPILSTLDTTICFGQTIMVGTTVYSNSGSISENMVTAQGCDSLVTGTLTILPQITYQLDTAVCFGQTITVGTSNYVSSGTHIDILTAADGCDSTVFTNLVVAEELMAEASQTVEATAYQSQDGAATVNLTGGLSGYTFLWSDGQVSQTAMGLTGGETYCVTVTDDIGCVAEDCVLILFPSNILTDIQNDLLNCPGDTDGELSLSISNGVVPYDYTWANTGNTLNGSGTISVEGGTATINGLTAGTYSFTITDAFGIKVVDGEVLDPPEIMTTIDTILCFGESLLVGSEWYNTSGLINEVLTSATGCDSTVNGVVNILGQNEIMLDEVLCFGESLTVGTATYTSSGPIAEVLIGANGCDSLVNGNLTVLPQILTNLDTTICFGESLTVGNQTFSATTAFNEVVPAFNGCDSTIQGSVIVLPENTTNLDLSLCFGESLEVGNTTYTSSGMYTDILTSVEGCDSTVFTNLTILPELTVSVDINTEATAYLDPSGIAQVSPAGGAGNYIYQWSNGANTPLAANLEGGINYCVTVTDDAGCAAEDCVLMLFPSNIQTDLQDIILNCPGDTDGSLSLSVFNGVIPYNYQWQNASNSLNGSGTITTEGGVADIANLPQGTYSFTITDAFGETTATAQVNDPIPIITPLNETICFGESLVIGGSVYSTSTLVNETLTSFYGCDSVVAGILTVLPLNETIIDQTLCFGESLQVGTTTYSATGPINEVLQAFNGCDSLVSGVLTILPQISTSLTPEICFGDAFAVGTSSYNTSGTYVDVLPAANGCDSTIQTTLNVLAELSPVITQDLEASGLGAIDGVLSVQVSGGSGNFTYLWSDGQTSQQAIDLTGGTLYCVTITDDVGCSVDACQPVLFPVNIITDLENDTLDCIGTTDGLLSFSVSNGQAPYQYDWQNQDNSLNGNGMLDLEGGLVNINNLPAGAYTVTVSDPWGTTVISATVVEPEPIVIQIINPIDASCFGNCDAGATLQVNGGRAPYTYSWPNGESGVSTSNLCAGAHQVTITDALNCTALTDFTLNEPAEFIAQAMEVEPVNCFGGNDGQAVVTTNGTPIAYLWDTGETTELANQLSAGAHNVTITNFDNCTATTAVVISQPLASLSVDIFVENPISCASSSDGVLSASIVGGNGNESLAWSNGDLGMQARDLASGIYSLTITDNNGCTTTSSFNLEAPQAIAAQFQTVDVTCDGGENSGALLVEQVSGGVGPYLFSIDGNFFTADSVFVRMTAGNYDLAVEDAAGCIRIFPVLIAAPPVLQVQLGDDLDIALGETVELAPFSSSNNVLYQWSPDFNLTCDTCARQELIPTQSIDYMVQITDTLTNCIAEDAIRIEVRKDRRVYIPNAFSPNQDGVNDLLLIHGGTDVGLVWSFRIFNRWGAVVFERTNFPPNDDTYSWNGMHRGQLVDNGVYIFTAEVEFIDGKRIEYSGDVTIMR